MTEERTEEQTEDFDEVLGRPNYDSRHRELHTPSVEVDGLGTCSVTMKQRGASMNFEVIYAEPETEPEPFETETFPSEEESANE